MVKFSFPAIFIAGFVFSCCSPVSTDTKSTNIQTRHSDNNIRDYLIKEATFISDHSNADVHSLEDWKKQRAARYQEFLEMMGIDHLPMNGKRSDLNVKITGVIQKDGYRIEKLYYESLPGLYVRANLYIPDNISEPRPAILYVAGHTPDQKGTYQGHPRKFAQMGFVCMLTETIQFGEVRGEHWGCYSKGWFNWYSRGYNPGGVELWNSIRALDLLSSRPEVNPDKIGVTGISGGGSQTWYLAAADLRIKAAAAVCGGGTLKSHIMQRTVDGHCDCMMPINTYCSDFSDIGALIAPRPFLIAQSNRDGMYTIESVRELELKTKRIYSLYGKKDNISLIETPGGHSYHKISRENIFSFFMDHLMGKKITPEQVGDIDSAASAQASYEELKVYTDGPPKDDRTTTIQNSFIPLAPIPDIRSKEDLHSYRDSVKNFLKKKTFGAFPGSRSAFDQRLEFRSMDNETSGNNIYSFISEEGWRLQVDIHWKDDPDKKKPLLIVLRNYNEDRWASESFIDEIGKDRNVAFFEARGIGETGWDPNLQWHIRRASAWTGRTIASMQVYDVLRCLQFCRTLSEVDSNDIGIAARDEMAVNALYASLMDGKCQMIILKNPPSSQNVSSTPDGRGAAIEMLNCLKITDVNRLPALLAPAKIVMIGEVPTAYEWADKMLTKFENTSFERINHSVK